MKAFWTISLLICALWNSSSGKTYQVDSPDGKITVLVETGDKISYSVNYHGKRIIDPSTIHFTFKLAPPLGEFLETFGEGTYSANRIWKPVLKRFETIRDHHKGLRLQMKEKKFPGRLLTLDFRVFNDGVAFRVEFPEQDNNHNYVITDEISTFCFTGDHSCWSADYGGYVSHQESEFFRRTLSGITDKMVTGVPITIKINESCYAAITEAELDDYAGMYLKPDRETGPYALRTQLSPRHGQPEAGDKVIFKTPFKTPWRVIILSDRPGGLVESEIIQNLNPPCAISDPSWIKPGLSAWDHWWSGEVKMDNDEIKNYILLASEMGWPYMLIDWQWYGQFDRPEANIMKPASHIDMPGLLNFAKEKNVKCWIWLYWTDVDKSDWEKACSLYESWGIAGVKIDFMQRDDQEMVNWYSKIVKTAANHHLMVDFHGAYKPTGFRRTWPNLVTREGVLGNEYNKWSLRVTHEHLCTLPFTRMLAGPMDFTPGGFLNRTPDKFKNGTPANVMGTRCNTLAQFIIYDSPFMVACDHPDQYRGQTGIEFLREVKSTWDDTRVVNGEIGEYITMARRSGQEWFVASMTDSNPREIEVLLDFLGPENYKLVSFSDAEDANIHAENAVRQEKTIKKGDVIKIKMTPGGGYAAYLLPVKI